MNPNRRSELDPFRVILAAIAAEKDSDALMRAVGLAGISFDGRLSERDSHSHGMRIRVLVPRIQAAYDNLPETDRLLAANAMLKSPALQDARISAPLVDALARIGWSAADGQLVVASLEVREMFFPKGTPWDAFVVLKDVMAETKTQLMVIDAYCNGDLFHLLPERSPLLVHILCSKNADALAAEASRFMAQHPGVIIEIRKTKDFHDRFVMLDREVCVHVGASLKDAGKTAFMVNRVEDDANRRALLEAAAQGWAAGIPVP
jgi:hypothetical protein